MQVAFELVEFSITQRCQLRDEHASRNLRTSEIRYSTVHNAQ